MPLLPLDVNLQRMVTAPELQYSNGSCIASQLHDVAPQIVAGKRAVDLDQSITGPDSHKIRGRAGTYGVHYLRIIRAQSDPRPPPVRQKDV